MPDRRECYEQMTINYFLSFCYWLEIFTVVDNLNYFCRFGPQKIITIFVGFDHEKNTIIFVGADGKVMLPLLKAARM